MDIKVKELNDATNLVALAFCITALAFVAAGQPDIAEKMVIGALAFAGGSAATRMSTRSGDQPTTPTAPTDVVQK